jgi:hypothetical protein
MSLWTKFEFGIGGRKPARHWTLDERGYKKNKKAHYRKNNIWKVQDYLIKKNYNIQAANDKIMMQSYDIISSLLRLP